MFVKVLKYIGILLLTAAAAFYFYFAATLDGVSVDCKVTVKFTFGQWLLYIVCFGWIWM